MYYDTGASKVQKNIAKFSKNQIKKFKLPKITLPKPRIAFHKISEVKMPFFKKEAIEEKMTDQKL